jgi:Rad3-related DNA helicase
MVIHDIQVSGNTFPHKDAIKATFRLHWKEKVWRGRYRGGSPLLPRLMAFCTRNRLTLEVDGVIKEFDAPQTEADFETDLESKQVYHIPKGGGGGDSLKGHKLPKTLTLNLSHQSEWVDTELEAPNWDKYAGIISNKGPYTSVRAEQKHLIPLICNALKEGYQNIVVECPTGSGKSMIAYALPLIFDSSAYLSTPLKGLQEQYLRDHPFMASAMGRNNYSCILSEEELAGQGCPSNATASTAPCRMVDGYKCEHAYSQEDLESILNGEKLETQCGYYDSYAQALKNRWFVGNTTFLTAMHLYGRPNLPPIPLLVVDEAHTLVSQLESFYDLRLSMRRLVRLLAGSESTKKQKTALKEQWAFPEIKSMKPDTSMETRHKDIIQLLLYLRKIVGAIESKMEGNTYTKEELGDAKDFHTRCLLLMGELQRNWKGWVYQYDDDETRSVIRFEPLSIAEQAKELFLELGHQRIFMSGTIISPDIFIEELGLKPSKTIVIRVSNSSFPAKSRPLLTGVKGGLMIFDKKFNGVRPTDIDKAADAIARIAKNYPKQKGLILPYTDTIESLLVNSLMDNHPEIATRLLQHTKNPHEREEVLSGFNQEAGSGILMSTYANQGYDNEHIHFVIIVKLPFLSLADTKVRLRMKQSEVWYQTYTVRLLLQMYGRAMRSKDDWGHVYVIDAHYDHWFRTRNINRLLPPYIQEAINIGKKVASNTENA